MEKKSYLGVNMRETVKAKLLFLANANGRTMSAQITEMINRDYEKMLSAQSKLLSK